MYPIFLHESIQANSSKQNIQLQHRIVLLHQLLFLSYINIYVDTNTLSQYPIFLLYIKLPEHRIYIFFFLFFRFD